ncbi:MAG TPA: glycosyltransferase [Gammaproteobacteria bacterium]|nr:glycosyltransferase [Gammaproteobacteria bacterium]
MDPWAALAGVAALAWLGVALAPWQAHRTRERLVAAAGPADLAAVTVLVPARNEASHIGECLAALQDQGIGLHAIVIDDESEDATAAIAGSFAQGGDRQRETLQVDVVSGRPPPPAWGGKLWALQQGLAGVQRPYCLMLDADIVLAPHFVPALLSTARTSGAALVSVMARLQCTNLWERLLVPPFIFFFKLLYPFALVARRNSSVAAAAGGCVLVETAALQRVGAFTQWSDALIDDCTLARHIKDAGMSLSLTLSDAVESRRRYTRLADFWQMVSRTAYTQLRFSPLLLLATTAVMLVVFVAPIAAIALSATWPGVALGSLALAAMVFDFSAVSRFYDLPVLWRLTLPIAALLFLAMTWDSAINYYSGTRATWKSRRYDSQP